MMPLTLLACILVGVLANFWLLAGMPSVKPEFFLIFGSVISALYFLVGMPVVLAVLARKYRQSRKWTTNLVVSIAMILAFYISAVVAWIVLTPAQWNLSFLTTIKAAGDSETYGKLEDTAEYLLVNLLLISTISTILAGLVTAAVRGTWARYSLKH
jgi:hypothetical protein